MLLFQVYDLVGLTELYYAGSHGMDIMGPVTNTNSVNSTDQQVIFQELEEVLLYTLQDFISLCQTQLCLFLSCSGRVRR